MVYIGRRIVGVTWSSEKEQKSSHVVCGLGPRALRIPNTIMHAQLYFLYFTKPREFDMNPFPFFLVSFIIPF